jgi:hypothetical protein
MVQLLRETFSIYWRKRFEASVLGIVAFQASAFNTGIVAVLSLTTSVFI